MPKITGNAKAVLCGPIPSFFLLIDDNASGVPRSLLEGFIAIAKGDRPESITGFLSDFCNGDVRAGTLVNEERFSAIWNTATGRPRAGWQHASWPG